MSKYQFPLSLIVVSHRNRIAYLTAGGNGYAQTNFVARCPSCALGGISKEGLGVLKFAQDAVLDPKNRADSGKHRLGCYQACVNLYRFPLFL